MQTVQERSESFTMARRSGMALLRLFLWGHSFWFLVASATLGYALLLWAFPELELLGIAIVLPQPTWPQLAADTVFLIGIAIIAWFFAFRDRPISRITYITLLSIFVVLFTSVPVIEYISLQSLPTDEALKETFDRHEKAFNKLVMMSVEDSNLFRITKTQALTETCKIKRPSDCGYLLPEVRWEEYKRLFRETQVHMGLAKPVASESDVMLGALAARSLRFECEKGYAYSVRNPLPQINSLNDIGTFTPRTIYKRLNNHWYLYYVCLPS